MRTKARLSRAKRRVYLYMYAAYVFEFFVL